jgi:hypothetical protein
LLRAVPRAAGWGALAAFAALIAGRVARRGALPVPDAIFAIPPLRWAEIGGIGAGLAVLAWVLLRLLPGFTGRAVQGGFWTGLGAMAVLHQGATFLLFHLFHAVPAPGYSLAPMPQFGGMPELVALLLAGALAGVVLALLVQWSPLFWVPARPLATAAAFFHGGAGLVGQPRSQRHLGPRRRADAAAAGTERQRVMPLPQVMTAREKLL